MNKKSRALANQALKLFHESDKLILEAVKFEATAILNQNPSLKEFFLGNGEVYFKDRNGKRVDLSEKQYLRSLEQLIDQWDPYVKTLLHCVHIKR